jgi:hypothetical protein
MGYKQIILRNSAKCLKCNDEIESTHVHDFKWCSCQAIAVDGGHWYTKRVANDFANFQDTSEFVDCSDYVWDILARIPETDWKDAYEKITNHLKQRDEEDRLRREAREKKQS